jgi:hypothetical protein
MIGGWASNKFSIGAVRAALKWYRMKMGLSIIIIDDDRNIEFKRDL